MREKFKKALPKRLLAFALTVAMAVTLLPGMSMVAKASTVQFVDAKGNPMSVEKFSVVESTTTVWNNDDTIDNPGGYYVVNEDVTITGDIILSGTVNLILADGKTLTVNGNIIQKQQGAPYGNLNIWCQSEGTGAITIRGNGKAYDFTTSPIRTDKLTINGGSVTSEATVSGAHGIFAQHEIRIKGGTVTAIGGTENTKYGLYSQTIVYIEGGTVIAKGGKCGINSLNTDLGKAEIKASMDMNGQDAANVNASDINDLRSKLSDKKYVSVSVSSIETYPVWVAGIQVTEDNKGDVLGIKDGAKQTVIYTPPAEGKPATLTLNEAVIGGPGSNPLEYGIRIEENLNVVIENYAIIGNGDEWSGDTLEDESSATVENGIYAPGYDLSFSGVITNEEMGFGLMIYDYCTGIEANNISFGTSDVPFASMVQIYDYGKIILKCAINASGNVSFYGGYYDFRSGSNGINADGNVVIKNAKVDVDAGMHDQERESFTGIYGENVTIDNSAVWSRVNNSRARYVSGINAEQKITISGKDSYIEAYTYTENDDVFSVGIGSGKVGSPLIEIVDATVWAHGDDAAIWASDGASEAKPLIIGSDLSPMKIINANVRTKEGHGDAVTEGNGPMNIGYYDAPMAREASSGKVSALVVASSDCAETIGEYEDVVNDKVVIVPRESGSQQPQLPFIPSSPSIPEVTVPVSGEGTTNVTAKVEGSNATVTVDTTAINNAAGNTTQDKTDTITVDLSGLTQTVTSVTISKEDAANISSTLNSSANNKEFVEFQMKEYTVKVDSTAMAAVVQAAGGNDLKLVVETTAPAAALNENQKAEIAEKEVARTFEAYFVSNGTRIGNFNGGSVQVGVVEFKVPEGKDAKYYHVEYLPETGKAERYATRYMDGHLYFDTTHFSDYAIVYDESMENGTTILVHRMFNKVNGKHLLTTDATEIEYLLASGKWSEDEPIGRAVPEGTPIYRMFNKVTGEHLYTADANEVKYHSAGKVWVADNNGNPIFYAPTSGKSVYRLFNIKLPGVACHINSADANEINVLLGKGYTVENDGKPAFYLQ